MGRRDRRSTEISFECIENTIRFPGASLFGEHDEVVASDDAEHFSSRLDGYPAAGSISDYYLVLISAILSEAKNFGARKCELNGNSSVSLQPQE